MSTVAEQFAQPKTVGSKSGFVLATKSQLGPQLKGCVRPTIRVKAMQRQTGTPRGQQPEWGAGSFVVPSVIEQADFHYHVVQQLQLVEAVADEIVRAQLPN